jgi:hypothetical protein
LQQRPDAYTIARDCDWRRQFAKSLEVRGRYELVAAARWNDDVESGCATGVCELRGRARARRDDGVVAEDDRSARSTPR